MKLNSLSVLQNEVMSRYSVSLSFHYYSYNEFGLFLSPKHLIYPKIEIEIYHTLHQALFTNKMLATVSLSNEWFGVLKATGDVAEDQSNAGYFQLIVLPQDVAKGIGEPGTSARTMPISYTADVKLVLPKPDTVDVSKQNIRKAKVYERINHLMSPNSCRV